MAGQRDGFKGERSVVLPPMITQIERQDPLASSLFVTDIGYYPRAYNHFRERKEPITENVLIYCVEGSGWYRIGDETKPQVPLKMGEFVILPAGKPHAYGADEDPGTIYWIHFAGEHAAIYSEGLQKPHRIAPQINSRISNRNNLFDEIMSALSDQENIESLRYASSLLHAYLASVRYLYQYRHTQKEVSVDPIEASIHYMRENVENHITLDEIAKYVGYSPSHFSALFRKQTGESPLNYFNILRIERACELLRETDMKINQICYKVGIEDNYYYSRLFSQKMGTSPSKYREKYDKNNQS